jgi:hypothetical protein
MPTAEKASSSIRTAGAKARIRAKIGIVALFAHFSYIAIYLQSEGYGWKQNARSS